VLVVTRFAVGAPEEAAFVARAHAALTVLAARPGYRAGRLGRAVDDPTAWLLVVDWESVGAYRRALSSYEVKVHATPLLAEALDEPSAFEVLASAPPGGSVEVAASDRAHGADAPVRP
jgi:heme-degrading monooxygenase HmoA